jgi:N-methylhydantoinase A
LGGEIAQSLRRRFYTRYEQLYGRGSSYADAGLEIVTLRLRATAATRHPKLSATRKHGATPSTRAVLGKRNIYWADLKKAVSSPIYDGALLVQGNRVRGPAVIETTDTTVVVHPGRSLVVDAFGNFEIRFAS